MISALYYQRTNANLDEKLPRLVIPWVERPDVGVATRRAVDVEGPACSKNEKKFKGIIGSWAMRDSIRLRISLSLEILFPSKVRSLCFAKLPLVSCNHTLL